MEDTYTPIHTHSYLCTYALVYIIHAYTHTRSKITYNHSIEQNVINTLL